MESHKKQLEKFKEAARELECDESEEQFAKKMKQLVKPSNGTGNKGKSR